MQTVQIILGLTIIVLIFLDFFHTTLSGNGFGIFSRILNQLLNRLILQNRNRSIFLYSGTIHLLITTCIWLLLLFLGAFIVFSADDDMVIHGATGLLGSNVDIFYFTSYVLSTLGIGDFVPGNDTSRVLTGILSFSGFILITTGLTYLLSVINAVLSKKELSFFISSIGEDVEEIYDYFTNQDALSAFISDAGELRQQILKNASSYLAFPMVSYFLTKNEKAALILQLARLYEVLMVIRQDWETQSIQYNKLSSTICAIEKYLELGLEEPEAGDYHPDKLLTLRSYWKKYGYNYEEKKFTDKQFTSSLQYAGWDWKEVYKLKIKS
ncbi:potassium channel family protein [Salinimicrobium xinjiangense]|uniref:potassium channel family protein n=1 Tax=Salinimicrobium xinjiangense TaxID=438596 RepID=UPI0012EBCE3C|nr:potassium channel family protein [Salinimicrobium xinjiangense]